MKNKLSLITGGTSGIGYEVSKKLARLGHDLLLVYISDDNNAQVATSELKTINSKIEVHVLKLDLIQDSNIQILIDTINIKFKDRYLANFVSCHGRVTPGIFLQVKMAAIRTTLQEHLISNIMITHGILQRMCVQKFGRVVFVSSISAHRINRGQISYAMAKSALETFVQSLTAEYYQRNVTFNCVSPGLTVTKVTKDISEAMARDGQTKPIAAEEVANLIVYLCAEENVSISGTTFKIEAGQNHVNNNRDYNKLSFYSKKNQKKADELA